MNKNSQKRKICEFLKNQIKVKEEQKQNRKKVKREIKKKNS